MATATPKLPNHLRVCGFEFEVEKADGSGWEPIFDATCAFVRLHLKKTPQFFIHGTTHYEAKFRADGAMVQKNRDSGTEREVRLTPGFGFEEKGVTIKVRDPVVTEALLKVQSDGSPQRYSSRTYGKSPVPYEVRREADADGTWRIVQKNLTTLKERDIFLLPSYFAFEDDGWVPIVDASAMHAQTLFKKKSHTHNTRGVFRLQSKLDADGSLLQTDLVSNTTCRVRPVEESTRRALKSELEALKSYAEAKGRTAFQLLEHVYAKYEPKIKLYKNKAEAIQRQVQDADATTLKKVLYQALIHYHPDKNADFGDEWKVCCEEVFKYLNNRCDTVKRVRHG